MEIVEVFKTDNCADIFQLPIKRDWMEETYDRHAYNCFPVSLTNGLGWGLSFPEDITFIWDGISDSSPDHVKILQGEKYVYSERANATISFKTGLIFKTQENVSLLQMPVPNQFIEGAQAFTIIMSTSFYSGPLPCAWRITKPFVPITIKANTPFISLIPISMSNLQNSKVVLKDISKFEQKFNTSENNEYELEVSKINQLGKWTNFYRNAIDHLGRNLGNHEIKALRLGVEKDV